MTLLQQIFTIGLQQWDVMPCYIPGNGMIDRAIAMGHNIPHSYAPSGLETGGIAYGQVPRSPAHIRHPGTPERGGYQDGVWNAGALLGRIYPGHLCPRHYGGSEGGRQDHGKGSDGGAVNSQKSLQKARGPGDGKAASGHVFCPVWVTVWVKPVPRKWGRPKKLQKAKKITTFRLESGDFMVAGAGLEPTTSGL